MSRNSVAVALVLAMLTGILIGQFTAMESRGFAPRDRPAEGPVELVRAFYDGLNAYLTSGDERVFDLLAPGFQGHGALGAEPESAEELLTRLERLRRSTAAPHFRIEEVHDLGQLVQVRLTTGLPTEREAAGFSMSYPSPPLLEFLEVQGHAIVTRWAQDDLMPIVDQVASDDMLLTTPGVVTIKTERLALAPRARLNVGIAHDAWVMVEQGDVRIHAGSTDVALSSGKLQPFHEQRIDEISNPGARASVFWLVGMAIDRALVHPTISDTGTDAPGATVDMRLGPHIVVLPEGNTQLRIGFSLLTIPPGTQLISPGETEYWSLVSTRGTGEIRVQDGSHLYASKPGGSITLRERGTIDSGTGVFTLNDDLASFRATGAASTSLFLMSLTQID
jgi:hypothetical protein